jgi:hypothetical protein
VQEPLPEQQQIPLTYSTQGTFTVNWTFDDGNGNSNHCSQQTVVIVDDVTPPVTPTLATATGECSVIRHRTHHHRQLRRNGNRNY